MLRQTRDVRKLGFMALPKSNSISLRDYRLILLTSARCDR